MATSSPGSLALSGYVGYRLGRSARFRRALLWAGALLFVVLVAYLAVQVLKVLSALALTAGYVAFRSERSWAWMRASWGSYIRSFVRIRFPGLTARERSLVAARWLDARPLTGTFEPRSLQTGPP